MKRLILPKGGTSPESYEPVKTLIVSHHQDKENSSNFSACYKESVVVREEIEDNFVLLNKQNSLSRPLSNCGSRESGHFFRICH